MQTLMETQLVIFQVGPLQCPANDSSLSIHPEVVAPGHNVRSSVGPNSYGTKSGTSIAAHMFLVRFCS